MFVFQVLLLYLYISLLWATVYVLYIVGFINKFFRCSKKKLMYPFLHVYEHVKFCIDSITLFFFFQMCFRKTYLMELILVSILMKIEGIVSLLHCPYISYYVSLRSKLVSLNIESVLQIM
jgi:hypothetical protein